MNVERPLIFTVCLLLLLACIFAGACRDFSGKSQPLAENGVLDLSGWDFSRDGSVRLDGKWAFYWNELLTPEEIRGSRAPQRTGSAVVPDSWSSYLRGGHRLPVFGCATYRLSISLPGKRQQLAIKTIEINTAYTIWINGEKVASLGTTGKSESEMSPRNHPIMVSFPADGRLEMVIQVSNFQDRSGGLLRSIYLGTEEQLMDRTSTALAFDLFLFGGLLIISLYHAALFLLRRKDISNLYLGIFCLIIGLRSLMTGERFIYTLVPSMPYALEIQLECLTLVGAAFFLIFLESLFPEEFSKRAIRAVNIASVLYALTVVFTPQIVFSYTLIAYQLVIITFGLYAIYAIVRAIMRGREGAVLLGAGYGIFFLFVINDILHSEMIIQTAYVIPFGLYLFIFCQAFALAMRFSRSFEKVEAISIKLENHTNHLEDMVKERTNELEDERNKLKMRNEAIEKELGMARQIQQHLIPLRSPVEYISSLYEPMDHVGGDFYDFIQFRDSRKIGIFLSDVSGHGVPAAFITSMIKSILLQMGDGRNDPAALLTHLNGMLFDRTGGNFVTAFYGIYDPAERRILYSVAGHTLPYVIDNDRISMLDGTGGIPLAILDNQEMRSRKKGYVNSEKTLAKHSKLILYTDGLTEAVNISNTGEMFDETMIGTVFREIKNLPGRDFVRILFQRLVSFRGSSSFEDDVCLICLDV